MHRATADENRVSFPESYRDAFGNYLSLDRVQNPDQFIKLYANDIAMKGPGDGGELADGAIILDSCRSGHAPLTETDFLVFYRAFAVGA